MKNAMYHGLESFFRDEDAQAAVEYALLAFIFALACYGALDVMKRAWVSKWNHVKDKRVADLNPRNLGFSLGSLWGLGP
jgi:Flp pilus assembly pilin Flp